MIRGSRRAALTSAVDILPTLADIFGAAIPAEAQGQSLPPLMAKDARGHDVVLSGVFGGPMLICDGAYAFHYRPKWLDSKELYEYRLLPMHMRGPFSLQELRHMELVEPFSHTKGVEVLKIKARDDSNRVPNHDCIGFEDTDTRLYDLRSDPRELAPYRDAEVEARLLESAASVMDAHDAPDEMFQRFAIERPRVTHLASKTMRQS